MLVCPVCSTEKLRSEFPSDRVNLCKSCYRERNNAYKRSKKGLPSLMRSNQLQTSRKRGHPKPNYSVEELRQWLLAQAKYHELHTKWVESGYKRNLTPSCDRLDDTKPYTLENIQLVTTWENQKKQSLQRKYGLDTRVCRAVVKMDLAGNEIETYYSAAEATRQNPSCHNISEVINGIRGRTQTGGFRFKYK